MIDEVYVSKKVNLVNGKLVGLAVDENFPAGTILCFMIKSFSSKFKDVVSLFPISAVSGKKMLDFFKKILPFVENSGLFVDAISTDNHTANRSFYKLLSGGLIFSSKYALDLTKNSWLILLEIFSNDNTFSKHASQLHYFTDIFNKTFENNIEFAMFACCENDHNILITFLKKFFNCAMKNYLTKLNVDVQGRSRKQIEKVSSK